MSSPNANRPTDDHTGQHTPPGFDIAGQDSLAPSPPPGPSEGDGAEDKDLQQAILDSFQSEPSDMEFEDDLKKALEQSLKETTKEDEAFNKALEQSVEDARKDEQRRAWIREQQRLLQSTPGPSQTLQRPQAQAPASSPARPQAFVQAQRPAQVQQRPQTHSPRPGQAENQGQVQQPSSTQQPRPSQPHIQHLPPRPPQQPHAASTPRDATNGKCTICTGVLKQPNTTPCGHTFCHDCLMEWLAGESNGKCPRCGTMCAIETARETMVERK